jgi:hypothetical protein
MNSQALSEKKVMKTRWAGTAPLTAWFGGQVIEAGVGDSPVNTPPIVVGL